MKSSESIACLVPRESSSSSRSPFGFLSLLPFFVRVLLLLLLLLLLLVAFFSGYVQECCCCVCCWLSAGSALPTSEKVIRIQRTWYLLYQLSYFLLFYWRCDVSAGPGAAFFCFVLCCFAVSLEIAQIDELQKNRKQPQIQVNVDVSLLCLHHVKLCL